MESVTLVQILRSGWCGEFKRMHSSLFSVTDDLSLSTMFISMQAKY